MRCKQPAVIAVVLLLLSQCLLADNQERQAFIDNGFHPNHYRAAQQLNLDLENYKNYTLNRSVATRANVMMGVGAGLAGSGGLGGIFTGLLYKRSGLFDENYDVLGTVYIVTGSVFIVSGLGVLLGGISFKQKEPLPVFRKDGSRLSLIPEIYFNNNRYAAGISLLY